MEYELNVTDIMLGKPIVLNENVSIKNITVGELINDKDYPLYSTIFSIGARELFSAHKDVDELELRYPTVWEMMFDKTGEGEQLLGMMLGIPLPTTTLVLNGLAYWTGLDLDGFQKLTNRKIIHEEAEWIIDRDTFTAFCRVIQKITCYKPNEEFIAPKNMSDARFKIWERHLKNRKRIASKRKGSSIADKILIFQISFNSYVPLEEILKMNYYYFTKLFQGLSERELYLRNWDIIVSPKFDTSKNSDMKHWTEKVHV